MNELDKKTFKALSFFADNTRTKVMNIKEEQNEEYKKKVPEDIEHYLTEKGFIDAKSRFVDTESQSKYIISDEGLTELRELEKIKYRDKVVLIAGLALIASIWSLLKSYGVL